MRVSVNSLLAALPDGLTATVFMWTWIDPATIGGPARVKNLMLVMLFEFLAMHSSAMIGSVVISDMSRVKRFGALIGLSAAYLLFVLAFAAAFSSTWPIWVFAWLFVCRFWYLIANPTTSEDAARRMQESWGVSGVAYLLGVFITVLLPLPRLGITPDFVATIGFPEKMTGAWIDRPWIVLAFGAFYFGLLALSKLGDARPPMLSRAAPATDSSRP
jgi:hypothetical protein